jgi:hypothetical protein
VNRQEFRRTEGILRSHPDWSDELIAETAQVDVADAAAVRLAVETGPAREQEEAAS